MVLGATAGFQLFGQIIYPAVSTISPNNTSNTFLAAYSAEVQSASGRTTAAILFTMLGTLVAYLISTAAFSRLVALGNQLRGLPAAEKIATITGVLLGLLVTILVSPILLQDTSQSQTLGLLLLILVAVAFIYLGVVVILSIKDQMPWWHSNAAPKEAQQTKPVRGKSLNIKVIKVYINSGHEDE